MPREVLNAKAADEVAEMLDVVDAQDQVVGCASRAEIHRRGWRHRAVHILLSHPDGRVFLQRRSKNKDCSPGLWDTSAAGHVDRGEDYLTAAIRELAEELSISGATLNPLWRLPASEETGAEFVQVYSCQCADEPIPDAHEIADSAWFHVDHIDAWLAREGEKFTRTFREIYRRARQQAVIGP